MALIKAHLRIVKQLTAEPRRPSIAGSMLFVMAATLGSTMLGFGRGVIDVRYYGTRWELDTFLAAATIPTILFDVFNGALLSALASTFSEYITNGREKEASTLASTIINLPAIVLTVCAAGVFFSAVVRTDHRPWISRTADGLRHSHDALAHP